MALSYFSDTQLTSLLTSWFHKDSIHCVTSSVTREIIIAVKLYCGFPDESSEGSRRVSSRREPSPARPRNATY